MDKVNNIQQINNGSSYFARQHSLNNVIKPFDSYLCMGIEVDSLNEKSYYNDFGEK